MLSPQQLDNLVAPVALYPDPLLGQVLAASTYPLEIVEAQQWFGQNSQLQGAQLMEAARQQNWDASVQALVAFPDALHLLGNDVRWTTDLGNAFLAQQADVMAAVQRMRSRARANGRLATTPQQVVTNDTQNGQSAVEIQPANPQMMYTPVYQPEYVWGPPAYGAYPDLWYPPGFASGFGFGPGVFLDWLFPGLLGWGGWGWGCGWFGHGLGLFLNAGFFNHFGFHGGFAGGGFGGRTPWQHDPGHRMGVPYGNRAVASRFMGGGRTGGQFAGNRGTSSYRGASAAGGAGWQRFSGSGQAGAGGYSRSYRSSAPNYSTSYGAQGYRGATTQGYRGAPAQGYNGAQGYRGAPSYSRSFAPSGGYSGRPSYSAPRDSAPRSYSAPRYSAPRGMSAPRSSGGGGGRSSGFSGGHSSGGHSSGGHSSGGHSGGGHHR